MSWNISAKYTISSLHAAPLSVISSLMVSVLLEDIGCVQWTQYPLSTETWVQRLAPLFVSDEYRGAEIQEFSPLSSPRRRTNCGWSCVRSMPQATAPFSSKHST